MDRTGTVPVDVDRDQREPVAYDVSEDANPFTASGDLQAAEMSGTGQVEHLGGHVELASGVEEQSVRAGGETFVERGSGNRAVEIEAEVESLRRKLAELEGSLVASTPNSRTSHSPSPFIPRPLSRPELLKHFAEDIPSAASST